MNGEMILHSAVQQRKGKFQPSVIAKPSINYWKQAVMPVSMETLSHMYYIFFVVFAQVYNAFVFAIVIIFVFLNHLLASTVVQQGGAYRFSF